MKFVQALQQPQPAIAVPISASNSAGLLQQVDALCQNAAVQIAEWRVDTTGDISDAVIQQVAARLHQAGKLLLVTIRTQAEGGTFDGDATAYQAAYTRLLDLITPEALDVEARLPQSVREACVQLAHIRNIAVVASAHDFHQTPSFADAQAQLQQQSTWADVVKLACMPQAPQDTLNLLALLAWARQTLKQPAIVIGMGALGQLTRVASGDFAPGLTFATLGQASELGQASAPGQLSVHMIQALQEEFS
ncbi:type I 3-dehydroquinate dehydratase [Lacticaseibacillus porcinae]|uniref:type I 3-dehydroquinate dehydratase n=1 Tax=Lacticaseibacillus porcinae TaxID=1123687 RepID=UPI0013DE1F7B|nr:type I 3-dehydroquinate dehydratase [Lacticaseibacillus porcinae]